MKIAKGSYKLWEGFKLLLDEDIELQYGACYHLSGGNGAGKSSFIKRLLIPMLRRSGEEHYIIYLEQQISLQAYALRAQASLEGYTGSLTSELDYMNYLLFNLEQTLSQESRKLVVIADEFRHLAELKEWLKPFKDDTLFLYTLHHAGEDSEASELLVSLINQGEAKLCEK